MVCVFVFVVLKFGWFVLKFKLNIFVVVVGFVDVVVLFIIVDGFEFVVV